MLDFADMVSVQAKIVSCYFSFSFLYLVDWIFYTILLILPVVESVLRLRASDFYDVLEKFVAILKDGIQ